MSPVNKQHLCLFLSTIIAGIKEEGLRPYRQQEHPQEPQGTENRVAAIASFFGVHVDVVSVFAVAVEQAAVSRQYC